MSESTTCPNCSAAMRPGAAFCTSCGQRLETSAPTPPAAGTGVDQTRVDTPGLHDATQVLPEAPAAPPPPAATPWQPVDPLAPPAPTPTGPPTTAPWAPPPAPPAPTWQQPAPVAAPDGTWGTAPPGPASYPAAPGPGTVASKSVVGGALAVLGGIAVLVGLFTPWFESNQVDEGTSGWELVSGWAPASGVDELTSNDPYIVLALGIAAIAIGALLFLGIARPLARVAAVLVGIAVVGVMAYDWLQVTDLVADLPSSIEVTQAFGFFVTIGGGVLTALSALLPAKQ